MTAVTKSTFQPGFRISRVDIAVILIGLVMSGIAARVEWWMAGIVACAVGHFFLFCNVFRVSRGLEIAWAVFFVAIAAGALARPEPEWTNVFSFAVLAGW